MKMQPCYHMLGVVGSSFKMVKFEPTAPNILQQGGQRMQHFAPNNVELACCDPLAGVLSSFQTKTRPFY